jgi:hypothetical protein
MPRALITEATRRRSPDGTGDGTEEDRVLHLVIEFYTDAGVKVATRAWDFPWGSTVDDVRARIIEEAQYLQDRTCSRPWVKKSRSKPLDGPQSAPNAKIALARRIHLARAVKLLDGLSGLRDLT